MTADPDGHPVAPGSRADISARQDQPEHLQRLLAYSHHYIVGQRWRCLRTTGTIALVAIAPWIAWRAPSITDVLAAVAAGWLVAGRTAISWLETHAVEQAVAIQELYDTRLFHLPWNESLAGAPPPPEDIVAAARHIKTTRRYLEWYSIDLRGVPWPADVLLCQRQSMAWSRRDHRAYSTFLGIVTLGVVFGGLTVAIALHMSIGEYLIKVFLPSSPALLDTSELAVAHWRHADARHRAERRVEELWHIYRTRPADVPVDECRRVQDAAFVLRRSAPRVPGLFYRLRRDETNEITIAGTGAMLADE